MASQLPLSGYAQSVSAVKLGSPLSSWLVSAPSGVFLAQNFFRAAEAWRPPATIRGVGGTPDPSGSLTLDSSGVYVDANGNFFDASGALVNPYLARTIFNQYALPANVVLSDYKDEIVLLLFALVTNYRAQWNQDQLKLPDDFRVVLFQKLLDQMLPYMKRIYTQYKLPLVGKTTEYGMSKPRIVWAAGVISPNGTFDRTYPVAWFMTKSFADDYVIDYAARFPDNPRPVVVGLQPMMPSRCGAFTTLAGLS